MNSIPSTPVSVPAWDAVFALPFGRLGLRCRDDAVHELVYLPSVTAPQAPGDALGREVGAQLLAYCGDPDHRFSLPLAPRGSVFQRRVWQLLTQIPLGSTISYGEAARQLGSAARAVGQACRANPFPPLLPCHRIVARSGLGGFAGSLDAAGELLAVKRWLLAHEGVPRRGLVPGDA